MIEEGALAGLRVLDLTRVLAGPLCTMFLGDLGAEVIKVEQPGRGDDTRSWGPPFAGPFSAYFFGVNRNKRSLTLDLRHQRGRQLLGRLLERADVVVDNFKLGTMAGWGFDEEWYEAHAPQAVRCSITGYGSTGPKAGKPGYDFILQAETGLMAITGEAEGTPMKLGVAIVDICTGMMATISILAALEARHQSGRGQACEVTLHDTGLQMLANVASNYLFAGQEPGRYGNGHPNIVPYRTYPAADGDLALAVGNDLQFAALAVALGRPEWADDPKFATNPARVENRGELDAAITAIIALQEREYWIARLDQAGIPAGAINLVSEALTSEQTRAREMVVDVDNPKLGMLQMLGSPLRFSETPTRLRYPPPRLGTDTATILAELGLAAEEIEELASLGVT